MNLPKRYYLECDCHSPEHRVVFHYYPKTEQEDSELYLTYYLERKFPFFCRVMLALKYIFGYDTLENQFNETVINKESAKEIIELLSDYVEN